MWRRSSLWAWDKGAHSEVIDPQRGGFLRLFHRLDRQADDGFVSEQAACRGRVEVRLAQVYAIGARRQSDIDAVIDKERDAERVEQRFQRARELHEFPRAALLFAKLHRRGAAADRRRHDLRKRARAGQPAVRYEIEAAFGQAPHARSMRRRARTSSSLSAYRASMKRTGTCLGPRRARRRSRRQCPSPPSRGQRPRAAPGSRPRRRRTMPWRCSPARSRAASARGRSKRTAARRPKR